MTVNPCRLCAPLGAVTAFKGFAGMMPILHGSQGCATYIRRYLISHFREPVDVASSSFTEETAIFGGRAQLQTALANVNERYRPRAAGIASTCLSETIGEDVEHFVRDLESEGVPLATVSTASYRGSHAEGYRDAVASVLERFLSTDSKVAGTEPSVGNRVLLLPGMVSPADLRYLREVSAAFGLDPVLAPDYSETLDGGSWEVYHPMAPGGTDIDDLRRLKSGTPWLGLGPSPTKAWTVAESRLGRGAGGLLYPMGIEAGDAFFEALKLVADRPIPTAIEAERSRLLDSYADFHKYLGGVGVGIVADADLAQGTAHFLRELGMDISFVAVPDSASIFDGGDYPAFGGVDYDQVAGFVDQYRPVLLIGSSKLYRISRERELPLVRIGFPVHDRVGGARILHLGYRGSQQLLDRICNLLLEQKQSASALAYSYQ